jgi:hypothetical protein
MTRNVLALASLTLLLALSAIACKTSEPGVTNRMGTLVSLVDATPDQVATAAERALTDMKLMGVTSKATQLDGLVEARTAQNDEVTIRINSVGENVSEIRIRVGNLGDTGISQTILAKIKANLAATKS